MHTRPHAPVTSSILHTTGSAAGARPEQNETFSGLAQQTIVTDL
jgi:hypothetical protein